MKHLIILVLCIIGFSSCNSQEKETVYLIFKENNQVNCVKIKNKSYKRDDTLKVKYKGYMRNHGSMKTPSFTICQEKFFLDKKSKIDTVKASSVKKLNIVNFDYFIRRRFETNKVTKRNVFNKIYFLEKINEEEYIKYNVYWNQSAHNRGL